jgi:hypothetical protein
MTEQQAKRERVRKPRMKRAEEVTPMIHEDQSTQSDHADMVRQAMLMSSVHGAKGKGARMTLAVDAETQTRFRVLAAILNCENGEVLKRAIYALERELVEAR